MCRAASVVADTVHDDPGALAVLLQVLADGPARLSRTPDCYCLPRSCITPSILSLEGKTFSDQLFQLIVLSI